MTGKILKQTIVLPDYQNYSATDFLDDDYFIQWQQSHDTAIIQLWEAWLQQHPEKQEIVQQAIEQYKLLVSFKKIKASHEQQNAAWLNIEQQIQSSSSIFNKRRFLYWMAAAAVIAIIAISGLIIYNAHSATEILITSDAKTKTILLPDSSVITLNNTSSLKYMSDNEREVWIDGSAHFVIKPVIQSRHKIPFLVHAGQMEIKVLGTVFSVVNTHQQCLAVLKEGSIEASAFSEKKQLVPGEKITLIKNKLETNTVNPDLYNPWMDGSFRFDKTNIEELGDIVSVFYGRELIVQNKEKLKTKSISGIVTANDTTTFVKTLEILLNANIELKEKQIIINPK